MNNRSGYLYVAILIASSFFVLSGPKSWAAAETLDSSALRIELNTSPYSFRILEKSTGEVLLSHSSTAFTADHHVVTQATDVTKQPKSLQAALVLAGTDKKAHLTFTFSKPEVVQVKLAYDDNTSGETYEEFNDQNEHYYGIWEYPFAGSIDNRGTDQDFLGFRHGPDVNYDSARAPFYMTSKKYALYVESTAQGHYTIAKDGKTGFSFLEPQLTYDVIYGPSYSDMLNRYVELAGGAFMPPTWAFGTIWWRDDNHEDLGNSKNAQELVMDDADHLRSLHIPASAIWLDRPFGTGQMGWGNMDFDPSFPDPPKMISDLKDRGMFLLIWIANRSWNQLYKEGTEKGYLFPGIEEKVGPAGDERRPEVNQWLKDKLNAYVRLGIKGYKIDRGEEEELPHSFENLNAILYPKLAAEGLADAYGKDYFIFTRNVNDTARKYTAVWNGDTRATFPGLAVSVKTGQRSGAINFPMWGSDTGGYINRPAPTKELFARWLEFSAYSSMMEVMIGPKRTIWYDYDPELVDITRKYTTAHHDLIPYTRSYMYQATQTGMPIMRSLIFAYPSDTKLYDTWDEYLYGADLLVAPVTTEGATSRNVYLPDGIWMDYNDKTTLYKGASAITAKAPLGTIPVFVREGAIIPRGDILKANNSWDANWSPKLRIEVFPSNTSASQFDYFTGDAAKTISVAPKNKGIEISFADLGVNGDLEVYCNSVKGVVRNGVTLHEGTDYKYDAHAQKLTIPFKGATTLAIQGAQGLFIASNCQSTGDTCSLY
ncbi:MAG TPA: TIM-barrel domain-containing protein [Terriglobales bacterium]|jgi:alpha-D-xyloside xylohydrolase|nr:TIM-barrel domain-containing protein [Terriglobales bacterium]